jgi:DNA-binding transcriptional LysR family regulator
MAYFEFCSRIINDVEEAELSVTKLHKDPRGSLKVLAPKSFGLVHVAPAICAFSKRYPEIKISLMLNDNFVDLMDNGFDLAIKTGELVDSSLVARRLGTTRFVACAAPAYLAAHGAPRTPQDLAEHNCLAHINQAPDQTWHFIATQGNGGGKTAGKIAVKVAGGPMGNSVLFLRHAALDGLGVALLPEINIHDDLTSGLLVQVLSDYQTEELPFHVVYPHNRHLAAKVRAFVDCLVDYFKGVAIDQAPPPPALAPAPRRKPVRA